MKKLLVVITEAESAGRAVGHFNFSTLDQLKAIVAAARAVEAPVILGLSEGEREFVGIKQAVALVRSLRTELKIPVYLNADHTYDLRKVKEAAEAGFDAIIFDGASLPLRENVVKTKKAVEIAKEVNPDIVVEGEIGYIGQASKILDELPAGAAISGPDLPRPDQAAGFVRETGIDLLAPAVGNIHGMLRHRPNPHLDIARIREIRRAAGVPLVLHGGSGTRAEDIREAIKAGIGVVHVSTELRAAWRAGLEEALKKSDEVAPYKLLAGSLEGVEKVASGKMKIFGYGV